MDGKNDKQKITVFYDGMCPMCSAIMNTIEGSSKEDDFDLRNMHTAELPSFLNKAAIDKEIHVIGKDGKTYKNAEAILKILEAYPRLKPLAHIGKLPVIKSILPIGYNFVAANRKFLFGPAARVYWLKVTVLFAFAIGLVMSAGLWLTSRSYPSVPALNILPSLTYPFDYILYGLLFCFVAASLISYRPQKFIWVFVGIITLFCLLDWTRWQPWVFQYTFILVTLALFSWKSDDTLGYTRVLNIARLVVASTYIYSGLQKINPAFMSEVFPWIVLPITNVLPQSSLLLYPFGILAPFLQVAFGVGLLTKRFRRISVILAVAMHVFILAMIGPFGLNWNSIVWPWTTTMVIFDLLLFTGKSDFSLRDIFWSKNDLLRKVALASFVALPFFSFFNLWDSYLSSALYSGNITEAAIYLSDKGNASLPANIKTYTTGVGANDHLLNIQTWSISENNVPPYPETRVYKGIAKSVCNNLTDPTQMMLIVSEKRLFNSSPQLIYKCSDL